MIERNSNAHASRRRASNQRAFAAALLDPAAPLPDGIIGPDRLPSIDRFNVYRNNVVTGLTEALKASYPAVCRIVGDDFFSAMARFYCATQPPASPMMFDYGATFPAWIESFEPANGLPYLPDVARLERARVEAYHAAEAAPIETAALADVCPTDFAQLRLRLHPSLRVVRSAYPVITVWQMNLAGGTPAPVDIFGDTQDALVVRPHADVEVRTMPPGAAPFVQSLLTGMTVIDATTRAISECASFDLTGTLSALFDMNAVIGCDLQEGLPANKTEG